MPNGFLLQWGKFYGNAEGQRQSFPVSFNALYAITIAHGLRGSNSWAPTANPPTVNNADNTGFGLDCREAQYLDYYWMAIGH